jgi:hypothetical protein
MIIKRIRKIFFKVFKCYRRLEFKACSYAAADILIRQNEGKPENEQWVIAKEEDRNRAIGLFVFLERRERITE